MEERDYLWKKDGGLSNNHNKNRYNRSKLINQIKGAIKKKSPVVNNRKYQTGMNKPNNHKKQFQNNGHRPRNNNHNNHHFRNNGHNGHNVNPTKKCNGCNKNSPNNQNNHNVGTRVSNNNNNLNKRNGLHKTGLNNKMGQRPNHFKRNNSIRSLPNNIVDHKLENNDKTDIRFDLKGVQHRILCQKLEREIINIVPRIIDSISDDMIDFATEINEEREHDKKMRERLHLE